MQRFNAEYRKVSWRIQNIKAAITRGPNSANSDSDYRIHEAAFEVFFVSPFGKGKSTEFPANEILAKTIPPSKLI